LKLHTDDGATVVVHDGAKFRVIQRAEAIAAGLVQPLATPAIESVDASQRTGWQTMPMSDYLALPGISSGDIRDALDGTIYAPFGQRPPTRAQILGTCIHSRLLEGEVIYHRRPEGIDLRTKEGKAWRETLPPGSIEQPGDVCDVIDLLALRWQRWCEDRLSTAGRQWWHDGLVEHVHTWGDCKIRPDLYVPGPNVLVSLKSCTRAQALEWERAKLWSTDARIGYDVQEAHYIAGITDACGDRPEAIHAVVTTDTAEIFGFVLGDDTIDRAERRRQTALEIIRAGGAWAPPPLRATRPVPAYLTTYDEETND
jgi:hypothetical protein